MFIALYGYSQQLPKDSVTAPRNEISFNISPLVSALSGEVPDNVHLAAFYKRSLKKNPKVLMRAGLLADIPRRSSSTFVSIFEPDDSTRLITHRMYDRLTPVQLNLGLEFRGRSFGRLTPFLAIDVCGGIERSRTGYRSFLQTQNPNGSWQTINDLQTRNFSNQF
jgi:hypothetical protein